MNDQALPRLPFEDPERPAVAGLVETVKLFVTDPTTAFRRMSLTTGIFRPLIYGVLLAWAGQAVAYLFGLVFQASIFGFLSQIEGMEEALPAAFFGMGLGIVALILAPFFFVISIFVYSLIVHLFLMMVGGDQKGFGATFRVLCYGNTSQLAQIVPIAGGIISLVWSLILCIVGLTEAHRTTTGKAAAAVLLPIVACCVCAAIFVMLAIAFGLSAENWV